MYQTLQDLGNEYGLSITDSLTSPWAEGESAIQSYSEQFGITMSATVEELLAMVTEFQESMLDIEQAGTNAVNNVHGNIESYTAATYQGPTTESTNESTNENSNNSQSSSSESTADISVGSRINAKNAKIYDSAGDKTGERQYYRDDPIYIVLGEKNDRYKVRHHKSKSGVAGWFKKSDVEAYAKGTLGVDKNQLALIDELGEELVMHAGENGKLTFLSKGSSVVPHDITENLMQLGELNPQDVLDRSRPVISAPHITNNNIEVTMEFGEVVHIDTVTNDTIPNLTKAIEKQMDKYMKNINNNIRKYTR